MKLSLKRLFLRSFVLLFITFVSLGEIPQANAINVVSIKDSMTSWKWRFTGYRSYRVSVPLKDGSSCIVGVSMHVNPKVRNYTALLMGFGADRWSWDLLLKQYRKHPSYSGFIAIDWPHHGDTACDNVKNIEEVVDVIDRVLIKLKRPVRRIVGASLGTIPAALLSKLYPDAQQVWLTPPFLKTRKAKQLRRELLSIDSESKAQALIYKSVDERAEKFGKFPNYVLKGILERMQSSQKILKMLNVSKLQRTILTQRYNNLLVILGGKDELTPVSDLHPQIKNLVTTPIVVFPCSHNILKICGGLVKDAIENSRLKAARY